MKKFLSVVMALAMTLTLVTVGASAKDFTDDSTINYSEAVDVISALGVVDGYTDGSFNPTATLTRGAAAKIICNLILGPTTAGALGVTSAPFSDVPVSNVFAGYIAYCSQAGIINGYGDGTFKPAATVTGYQFMKMLLGALGYDGSVEGFTGTNWTVAVAKLAVSIGLNDGNDSFIGSKAMTREEAALYAYNTLTATMVEYATSGTTITIGGTTISQGASKASDVANKNFTYATVITGHTQPDGYVSSTAGTMQFCEKYFKDLKMVETTDAFGRPAEKWTYKGTKIGTYADTADLTYTASVKMGTLYTDLGLSSTVAVGNVTALRNDASATSYAITRGDTSDKLGGNGVLTQVYKDYPTTGKYLITMVDTFAATVQSVKAATSSTDRTITLAPIGGVSLSPLTATFETESFATDDVVSYTVAYNADTSKYEIQSVSALDKSATGTLTAYTTGSSMVVAGTTYKNSAKMSEDNGAGSVLTSGTLKNDVDVYLDAYGYVLYIVGTSTTTNYAVVLGYGGANSYGSGSSGATLLLADGTIVTASYKNDKNFGVTLSGATATTSIDSGLYHGQIVTYSTDSNGVYTLTAPTNTGSVPAPNTASSYLSFTNGKSALTIGNGSYLYATSATVFGIRTGSSGSYTYSTYTGYAAAPSFAYASSSTKISYVVDSSNPSLLKAVYVEDATVTGTSATTTFIVKGTSEKATTDSNDTYYTLNAVVDGAVTTLMVSKTSTAATTSGTGLYTLLNNAGNYVLSNIVTDSNGIVTAATVATASDKCYSATGTVAMSNDVVGFGDGTAAHPYAYYAFTGETQVFYVDTDGNISVSSVNGIATDTNDTVQFVLSSDTNSKTLAKVFIQSAD